MKSLFPVLLLVASAAFGQETHTVTALPMPVATFDELAAEPQPSSFVSKHEHRRERRATHTAPAVSTTPPTLTPPALGARFADETEVSIVPADAAGAVGRTRVVGVNNKSVYLHDRSGGSGTWAYLAAFFSTTNTFDPRVAYDARADRWVIAALRDDPPNYANATFLLAVSDTNDPQGAWHRYRIPANTAQGENFDFTQMALTRDNILVTVNLYSGEAPTGSRIYLVSKASAYSSTSSLTMTVGTLQQALFAVPVATYDSTDASSWILLLRGTAMDVYDAATGATVTSYEIGVDPNDNCCGIGKQLGTTSLMDVGWAGLQYALTRNHKLWGVETRTPAVGNPMAVLVFNVDLTTAAVKLWQIANADTTYTFPSIAVNRSDAAVVAFSAFGASTYPSAAFSYIAPDGQWSSPSPIASGLGPYTVGRWGDFTTTVVDPVDDMSFWTTQVIALAPSSSPTWSTRWIQIPMESSNHRAARH